MDSPPDVLAAILAVAADIGAVGVSKDRKNQQQGYAFRGIDEMLNALSPLYVQHGLIVLPRMVNREAVERTTAKGSPIFYVTVWAEFDFTSTTDGSVRTVRTYGEAMDTADKATNKAMSAAYKYAVILTFAIPTEGDNDADATTHELAAQQRPQQAGQRPLGRPLAPAVQDAIAQWADEAIATYEKGNELAAYQCVAHIVDPDEMRFLWDYLVNHPGLREAIRRMASADASTTTSARNPQGAPA